MLFSFLLLHFLWLCIGGFLLGFKDNYEFVLAILSFLLKLSVSVDYMLFSFIKWNSFHIRPSELPFESIHCLSTRPFYIDVKSFWLLFDDVSFRFQLFSYQTGANAIYVVPFISGLKNPFTLMSYVTPVMAVVTLMLSLGLDPWKEFTSNGYFNSIWHVTRSSLLMLFGGALAFCMVGTYLNFFFSVW